MSRLGLWWPVAAQMVVIFVASSIPNLTHIPGDVSDKTAHFAGYALLGAAALRALARASWAHVSAARGLAAWALCAVYALTDEWHQTFVPGRTAAWDDLVADGTGAAAAVLLGWVAGLLVRRRRERAV